MKDKCKNNSPTNASSRKGTLASLRKGRTLRLAFAAVGLWAAMFGAARAHNLDAAAVYVFFDPDTREMFQARIDGGWIPGDPLLQNGDEIGMIIKAVPNDGTDTGVGGYSTFYVPAGTQVIDAAYLQPGDNPADGISEYDRVPMKAQALMPNVGAGGGPTVSLVGLTRGPNVVGASGNFVSAGNVNNGTLPGVYGDLGIFYSTSPQTGYGSYSGGNLTNNSGDTVGLRTDLGTPLNEWDAWQMAAFGIKGTTNPLYPSSPIIDSNGRGNTAWGLANAVAGPESGYAWQFDFDEYMACDPAPYSPSTACIDQATQDFGPWQRIRYPGSQIASDVPGDLSPGYFNGGLDASSVGFDLTAGDLPVTTGSADGTPNAVRWAFGQLTLDTPEFAWVKLRVIDNVAGEFLDPTGCPRFNVDTFGGDAGGESNGKDHIWRYYDPNSVRFNGCLGVGKVASRELVKVGDVFQYDISVSNLSGVEMANVVLTDELPSGVTFLSSVPAQTSGPNPLVYNVGPLLPGTDFRVTVTVEASGSGELTNEVCAAGTTVPDNAPVGACAIERTPSGANPLLKQGKTVTPTSVAPGGTVTYTIDIDNIGSGPTGSPVVVTENLPTGFSYTSLGSVVVNGATITGSTGVDATDPNAPVFTLPVSIQAGKSALITFDALVAVGTPSGEYCNSYNTLQNGVTIGTGSLACLDVGGGTIGDTFFRDWNGNGTQDAEDEGLPGVTVDLYAGACPPAGLAIDSQVTDGDGFYQFTGLVAGDYCVDAPAPGAGGLPTGYALTTANDPTSVTLAANEKRLDVDFGYQPGGTGVIGDTVFEDVNNDGLFNGADVGIAGITVELYEDTNGDGIIDPLEDALIATDVTDGSGNYDFSGLAEGLDYLVLVDESDPDLTTYFNPLAYVVTTDNPHQVTNLTGTYDDADFGFWGVVPGSIGDEVFLDNDGDGVFSAGDAPLPGVDVFLYRDSNGDGIASPSELIATEVTDGSGIYTFDDLGPDDYIVVVNTADPSLPSGISTSVPSYDVTLAGGEDRTDIDFPFVPLITKTVDITAAASPPQLLTYTIQVTPPGSDLVTDLQVTDNVPVGATFVSASHGASESGGVVTWELGSSTAASDGVTSTTPFIYGFRGDDKEDFWRFDTTANSWTIMADTGATIKEGGALVWDEGNFLYALRGDNSREFLRFDLTGGTWAARADLVSADTVKEGGALTYLGGFAYALVGNGGDEFQRYDPGADSWVARAVTPEDVKQGGALATDGTYIYAFRGDGNPDFWRYDPVGDSWTILTPAPEDVKDGGALVFSGGDIYALRGDGKGDFWRYSIGSDSWTALATLPFNVKQGGALTQRDGRIYAFRGDGKKDFYRYTIATNTWTARAEALENVKFGGALASVAGGDEFLSSVSAAPTVAADGGTVTVTLTLGSSMSAITGVVPPALGSIGITTVGGAGAVGLTGPSPASVDVPLGGSVDVEYTFSVSAGAVTVPQSVVFDFPAFSSGAPATNFAAASSHSVIVVPDLTMTVNATVAGQIDNTAEVGFRKLDANQTCLVVADVDTVDDDDPDSIVKIDSESGIVDLGFSGTTQVEAIAWDASGTKLYAVDRDAATGAGSDLFGRINPLTGAFSSIGRIVAPGNPLEGSLGDFTVLDVDAMATDPTTGIIYAIHRREDATVGNTLRDVLFQIDPATGLHIEDAYGGGQDYEEVSTGGLNLYDIDGLGFDSLAPNDLYAIANDTTTGTGDGDRLVIIDKTDGSVTDVQRFFDDLDGDEIVDPGEEIDDIEGMSFAPNGTLFVTTGASATAGYENSVLTVDQVLGIVAVSDVLPDHSDYEAIACVPNTPVSGTDDATTGIGAQIGDFVWIDSNGDGIQDVGEAGLPGAVVYLDEDADGILDWTDGDGDGEWDPGEGERWTTTDLNGGYLLAGLTPDTYDVKLDFSSVPAGYFPTTPGQVSADLNVTPVFETADFGVRPPGEGSIGDTVWLDADADGVLDAGEAGLPDITVTLYLDNNNDGVVDGGDTLLQTTLTDASGNYLFDGLYAGDYLVVVDETSSVDNPNGGTETIAGAMEATTGTTNPRDVTLATDSTDVTDADFGYRWGGSIGDFVWYDKNGDTLQDGPALGCDDTDPLQECGAAGSTLVLYLDSNGDGSAAGEVILAVLESDANGAYLFDNLPPGDYLVSAGEQEVPAPLSSPNAGQTSTMNFTTSSLVEVPLAGNEDFTDADFGLIEAAKLEGHVFYDPNRNGILDGGETRFPGVEVTLTGTDINGNPINIVTTTDGDGEYKFLVPPGDYVITYDTGSPAIPAGISDETTATSLNVSPNAGQEISGLDFGRDDSGEIGDRVWNDTNGDGIQDASESGLEGVTVLLYLDPNGDGLLGDATLVDAVATDASGNYLFPGLAENTGADRYVVVVDGATVPASFSQTGDPDEVGTCVTCDDQSIVLLGSGASVLDRDFGYRTAVPVSVSGTVFNDDGAGFGTPGDGVQNGGETGLGAGVTVEAAIDSDNDGTADFTLTTVTDANGDYTFTGIPSGSDIEITVDNGTLPSPAWSPTDDTDGGSDETINLVGVVADVVDQDFGYEFVPGSVSGSVCDGNGDGLCDDPGEIPGLEGVEITLVYAGDDGILGTPDDVTATVLTDANGDYTFDASTISVANCSDNPCDLDDGLPPGLYQILEETPVGTASLADADGGNPDSITIVLALGEDLTDQDFEETTSPGAIGDRVWLDEDGDGVQDAGEDGIAGVTVRLFDNSGVALLAETVTGADGSYIFPDLAPGDYFVEVDTASLPSGSDNATFDEDDGTVAPDARTAVTLSNGEFHQTADFGFNYVDPTDSTTPGLGDTGAIGDRIWNDADADGVQDPGEAGIEGVTVTLLTDDNGDGVYGGVGDNAAVTTTTDASGNYTFDDLPPGSYVVEVDDSTLPAGFLLAPTGDPDGDGDSTSNPIQLAPGDVFVNADFGYTNPGGSTIGDTIFLDLDADGIQDAGDPGLAGVTVTLLDDSGEVVATTVTDAAGLYAFEGLPDGTYTVSVTDTANILADTPTSTADPDGGADRQSTVVLVGADDLDQDFGFAPLSHDPGDGLIGDTIFLDADGNGAPSAGEGLEGVLVELYDAAGLVLLRQVTTDANGTYFFGGLDPTETYVVRVDTATLPNAGAGLFNSVDPDGATANESTVDLGAVGGTSLDEDFGYETAVPNTIGGTVWDDVDGDGTLDGSEAGRYEGVTIVLRDSDGDVVATTTTDASGNYEFTGIPDGTYTVDVIDDDNVLGGLTKSDGPATGSDGNSQPDPYTVTVGGGVTDTTGDFGYLAPGALLGDLIFVDEDADGLQDAGEPGIAGVDVVLTITYPTGDVVTVVTTTDANGFYSFDNLLLDEQFDGAGFGEPSYEISVATPAGFAPTTADVGGDDTIDSDDPTGTTATPLLGQTDTSYDFGFVPEVDLALIKDDVSDPVTAGGSLTYTLTVENLSAFDATNVTVVDTLDGATTYVSDTASGGCVELPAGTLTCDLGTLAAGGSTSFTVTVAVDAGAPTAFGSNQDDPCDGSEDLCNTATVSADQGDPVPGNDTDDEPTGVVAAASSADLSVTKTDNETEVPTGTSLLYALVISNAGPDPSGVGVTLSDTLPDGLTVNGGGAGAVVLAGVDAGDWTCTSDAGDPQTISCVSSASIGVGGSSSIAFTSDPIAASLAGETLTNTITVATPPGVSDSDPSNDTDTDVTDVTPVADLEVEKDDGQAVYTAGETLVYTITVTNNGPSDVAGATVTDSFPAQLPMPNWTCVGTGAATCPASGTGDLSESVDIPSGEAVVFTVTVDVVDGATVDPLINIASATVPVGTTDPVPGNNSDDDQDTPTVEPGTLGDRVWLDEDGDGVQDAGEDGLAGVTVGLYDPTGTVLLATTTTGADGEYIFTDLAPSDYVVRVDATTLPAGLAANATFDEDDGTVAPDGEALVTVVSGEYHDTADFGYNWVPATDSTTPGPGATGAIGDRIWNDANGDGVQDPGEVGIEGVTVRLLTDDNGDGVYGGVGDNPAVTTTTDSAGNYIFDGLPADSYVVEVDDTTLPSGFTTTPTGDPDGDGDSTSEPIALAPGDVFVNADFGYTNPTGSTIGDTIYLDVDGDGVQDPGEIGIPGVTVTLLDSSGEVIATDITDEGGLYEFPGLIDGTYTVVVTDTNHVLADTPTNTGDPDGGGDRQSTVVVAGADELGEDFGFAPDGHEPGEGLIGDTIFLDRDADGLADAGEGIEGVTVELYDSTGTTLVATVVTDANGNYVFGGLDPNLTYVVQVDPLTLPSAGAGLVNTFDPDGGGDSTSSIDLSTVGGKSLTQDFGYQAAAPNTISGTVWGDSNADGTQDGTETAGYEGVTVVLRDSDGNVVATTTTDANGDYSFEGLPDGDYTVDVTDDANVLGGLWKSDGPNPGVNGNSQTDVYPVTVVGGVVDDTGDFGYYGEGASLSDFVFTDSDGDGIQDAGELGIAGVSVLLTIDYPNGDTVVVTTVTDVDGLYSFDNLLLDESFNGDGVGLEPTYTISIGATPAGFTPTLSDQGGDDAVDSDDPAGVAATPVQGATDPTYDFGFVPEVDLALIKDDVSDPVTAGGSLTYTVSVENLSAAEATNVTVVDTLDGNTSYVSDTASGGCVEAPVGVLTCDLGTIAGGATQNFTITVSVSPGAPTAFGVNQVDPCDGSEDLCNTAIVSADQTDPVPGNDSDDEPTGVVAPTATADLSITKTDGQIEVPTGTVLTYALLVSNAGPDPSGVGVTVVDTLPSGLTVNGGAAAPVALGGVDAGAWTCTSSATSPQTISCTSSVSIAAAGSSAFNFATDAIDASLAGQTLTNTATVAAPPGVVDPNPGNDTDTDDTDVTPEADLGITKDDGQLVYVPGETLIYTIVVSNAGPNDAPGASVSDVFPPQLTNPTWTCAATGAAACGAASGSGDIAETIDVPVGDTVVFTVTAEVLPGATVDPLINVATVTAPVGITDPVPGNNTDDDQDTRVPTPGAIGDRVWLDEDGDGVQDAGEDGVAGVVVRLYDVTGTILLATTTTDLEGNYLFSDVAPGDYVVRVNTATLPSGLATHPTFDEDDGTVAPDSQTAVSLAEGELYDTADFGYNYVDPTDSTNPAPGTTGAIGDRIWNDANADGVQDPGESGLEGVTVRLLTDDNGDGVYGGVGDNPPLVTVTDPSGHYVFDDLPAGSYVVDVDPTTLPVGVSTTPTGDPDGDGDTTSNPIPLAPGDVFVNADFGFPNPAGSTIGDTIYLDVDGDGVEDAGEPGIAGVTVSLLDNSGNVIASTTTDSAGQYAFPGLVDGNYSVLVTDTANVLGALEPTGDPDGGLDYQSAVVLAGTDDLDQDFGFTPLGQDPGDGLIGDTIFLDADGSGFADPGEGLEGVLVELYDATGTTLLGAVTTDPNGNYYFGGLDPTETYVVRVDPTTLPNGGAGLTNTVDPDGLTANESVVDLLALGGTSLDEDFGYEAPVPNTIGGTVWQDDNGDGTLDGSEADRFEGVTIVLLDSDGDIVATTTTDAAGDYEFLGIPDGTYTVDVLDGDNVLGGLTKSDGPTTGADGNSQPDPYTVTVAGGVNDTTGDFGYYGEGASVGNRVVADVNGDGLQDVGELGVEGVLVVLTIDYPNGDSITVTTLTDVNGFYSFDNLLLDEQFDGVVVTPTYTITATLPTDYVSSPLDVGGDDLIDGDDPAGVAATAVLGETDTTNDLLAISSYDFLVLPPTDVEVLKSDAPDPVGQGGTLTYTVTVNNLSAVDALDVEVVDTLDADTSYVSDTGGCSHAAGVVTCDLGTLAGLGSTSFDITVDVAASAPSAGTLSSGACTGLEDLCNSVVVTTTNTDTDPSNDSDDEPTDVIPPVSDLSIAKVDLTDPVSQSGSLTYELTVTNNGPDDALGVVVSDTLDANTTYVSDTGGCSHAAGVLTCNIGGLANAASTTFQVTVTVSAVAPTGGSLDTSPCDGSEDLCNVASVTGSVTDPVPGNDAADEPTDVTEPQADLSIVKTDGPDPAALNGALTYTLTVSNAGPDTATSVVVTDTLDANTAYVSDTAGCSHAAGTVTCNLGSLASGASTDFDITVTVDGAAPTGGTLSTGPCDGSEDLCNVASVTSAVTDPNPGDNTDDEPTDAQDIQVDLSIIKSDTVDPIFQGGLQTYEVALINLGPDDATGVVVTDTLDPNMSFVTASIPCTDLAGVVTCVIGDVAAGELITFELIAYVDFGAPTLGTLSSGNCTGAEDVCNTVEISANEPESNTSNNIDTEPTDIVAATPVVTDLTVFKTDLTDPVLAGADLTYQVEVLNFSFDTAEDVVVTDYLDANTAFISDTSPGGCVESPTGTLTCTVGSIDPFDTATFGITVSVDPGAPTTGTNDTSPCDGSEDLCNDVWVRSLTQSDADPSGNADDEPTDVTTPSVDLSLTKTDAVDPIEVGAFQTYTITVDNAGPSDAAAVIVTDTLDANTTYVSDTTGCLEGPVGTLTCPIGSLAAGASVNFDITVHVSGGAPTAGTLETGPCTGAEDLCNTATVSTSSTDTNAANDTDDEPSNVIPAVTSADIAVSKTESSGDPTAAGANLTYTITVTNAGPDAAAGVEVNDVLDANTTFVSDTAPGGCIESTPGNLTCTVGAVAVGSTSFDLVVFVDPAAPTAGTLSAGPCTGAEDLCNTVSVTSSTPDPDITDNDDDEPTDVTAPEADVSLVKSDSPDPAALGGSLTYTIEVTNAGPSVAENVTVVDVLDADTTYVSTTASGGCVEAPVGTLTCSLGDLAVGTTSFEIVVDISGSAPTAGVLTASPCDGSEDLCNVATVSTTTNDPNAANDSDDEPTDVQEAADLSIVKLDIGDPVSQAGTLTYSLGVTNNGPSTATAVVVQDVLDPSTTYLSDTAGCVEAPVGTLTCSLGDLVSGGTASFAIEVFVDAAAPIGGTVSDGACTGAEDLCNTADVSSSTPDPDPSNNTAEEPSDVVAAAALADLTIVKTDGGVPVPAGAFVIYTLTVTNNGPDLAQGVSVSDTLDANTTYFLDTDSCSESLGVLTCTIGNLAAGASTSFDVVARVNPTAPTGGVSSGPICDGSEDLCNQASVSATTADGDPFNNDDEVATDVTVPATTAALSLVKSDLTAEPIAPGDPVVYEITVTNLGPDTADDVVVYEQLGTYLSYVSDTAGCTAASDGRSLRCDLGTLAASASTTFQVNVDSDPSAPVNFTSQDGDCAGVEDLCNTASVVSGISEVNVADNQDSEPTDVSPNANCGDGNLDPGEQCEPPAAEICNNGVDDNGDLLIDCGDPLCAVPGFQSCDANCLLTPPCVPILNDPATIRVFDDEARSKGRRDRIKIHGRFIPETVVDPTVDDFLFLLSNSNGEIYRARLFPGDFKPKISSKRSRWTFKDKSAKKEYGTRGGLYRIDLKRDIRDGFQNFAFKITGYGDLSRATVPNMVTQVYVGDDVAFLRADWSGEPGRWQLRQSDYGMEDLYPDHYR